MLQRTAATLAVFRLWRSFTVSGFGGRRSRRRSLSVTLAKFMIALEVSLNGKLVCIAGAEDLSVLGTHVTATGPLGKETVPAHSKDIVDLFYIVGGLTSRKNPNKDVHMRWKSFAPLRVGNVIQVKILQTDKVDCATSRHRAKLQRGEPSGSRQRRVRAPVSKSKPVARRA